MKDEILDIPEHRPIGRVGFGIRLGALLLDATFVVITGIVLAGINDMLSFYGHPLFTPTQSFTPIDFVSELRLALYLNILIEMTTGSSIGKKILRVKIGNEDGTKTGLAHYFRRTIIKNAFLVFSFLNYILHIKSLIIMSGLFFLIAIIGLFFVLGKSKQSFHDMLSKTAIFRKKDLNKI